MSKTIAKSATIQEEIEYLRYTNNGSVSPKAMVEYARDPGTLLHAKFEWDDEKASDEYRIWQARQVLRVMVNVEQGRKGPIEVRTYVSMSDDRREGLGYRLLVDVLQDEGQREKLLQQARKDMQLFRAKYNNLKELSEVIDAMNKAS